MFLKRAYCIASPKGHGLPSDRLYDITRELVLHGADLEAKYQIMQTPKAAASCEKKNHGDLYILRYLSVLCPMQNSGP